MARQRFLVSIGCEIEVDDALLAAVLTDDWRAHHYVLHTPEEVAGHLAYHLVQGRALTDLDGFADQPDGAAVLFAGDCCAMQVAALTALTIPAAPVPAVAQTARPATLDAQERELLRGLRYAVTHAQRTGPESGESAWLPHLALLDRLLAAPEAASGVVVDAGLPTEFGGDESA